jgi:hypothetical protein
MLMTFDRLMAAARGRYRRSIHCDKISSISADGRRLFINNGLFHEFSKNDVATAYGVTWYIANRLEYLYSGKDNDASDHPGSTPQKFSRLPSDDVIREAIVNRLAGKRRVHVKPDIPSQMIEGARYSHANAVERNDVLFLVDNTVWGRAEYGLLATADMVFARDTLKSPVSRILGPGPLDFTARRKSILLDNRHFAELESLDEPAVAAVADALAYISGLYDPELSRHAVPAHETRISLTFIPPLPDQFPLPSLPPLSEKEILPTLRTLLDGAVNTFVSPAIPPETLKAAIAACANGVCETDVLFVMDETGFGGQWEGLLATRDMACRKELPGDPVYAKLGTPPATVEAYGTRIWANGKPLVSRPISAETSTKVASALVYLAGLAGPGLPRPDHASSPMSGTMPVLPPSPPPAGPAMQKILSFLSEILKDVPSVFVKPSIPSDKLTAAIKTYAPGVQEDDVLLLADTSFYDGDRDGLLATRDTVYIKDMWSPPVSVSLGPPCPAIEAKKSAVSITGDKIVNLFGLTETASLAVVTALGYLSKLYETPPPSASHSQTSAPDSVPGTFTESVTGLPAAPAPVPGTFTESVITLRAMLHGLDRVSVFPELDTERLKVALGGYASAPRAEDVVFLVHDTVTERGGAVMAASFKGIFARPSRDVSGYAPFSPDSPQVTAAGDQLVMGGIPVACLEGMTGRERQLIALASSFIAVAFATPVQLPGSSSSKTPSAEGSPASLPGTSPSAGKKTAPRPFWDDIPSKIPVSPPRNTTETGRVSLDKSPVTDADRARDAAGRAASGNKGD